MSKYIQILILALTIGFTKAHHFLHLIMLAGLGLGGLWMLQNFNKIFPQFQGNPAPAIIKALFTKRSVSNFDYYKVEEPQETSSNVPQIDWEAILSRDPIGCVRSFACQLNAVGESVLDRVERNILWLIRSANTKSNWAIRQMYDAVQYGKETSSESKCRERYKYCPFSRKMMLSLLKIAQ